MDYCHPNSLVQSQLSCTFSLLSNSNEQSSKVKNYMQEILSSLMQEGESLSQEIIDIVLLNIVEPAKVQNLHMHIHMVVYRELSISVPSHW